MTTRDRLSALLRDPLTRLIGGTAIVFAGIVVSGSVAALGPVRPYIAPVLFLYMPLMVDGRAAELGWRIGDRRGWLEGLASGVVIFAVFYLVTRYALWGPWRTPAEGWLHRLTLELLYAAIPEETFYRGWLLRQLDRRFRPAWGPAWLQVTAGNLVVAVVFALLHLADGGNPARLATFFPGLWFGWLAQRNGYGVGPAVVMHALSNTLMASALGR